MLTTSLRPWCWLLLMAMAQDEAWAADRMVYPCYRAPNPLEMDGKVVGDPVWERVPVATGFHRLGDGYTEAKQTYARACWDEEAFYVGVVCEEPDVALLRCTVRDGGETWLDDGVEVFLQAGEDAPVVQLVVTAAGARGGVEGAPDFRKYQAVPFVGPDFYSLEIRVPFDLLRAHPRVGDTWRGNFCRNIWTTRSGGDKFTSWAPLRQRFLEPEHFAAIKLLGPAPDASEAQVITERLNRRYRADITRRLRHAASRSSEYRPVLTKACVDERFRQVARDLLQGWNLLDDATRTGHAATLQDLRRVLRDVDALIQQSYDLKYRYLIAMVLGD